MRVRVATWPATNFRDVYVRCGKGQYVQGRVVHKPPAGTAWRPSPARLPEGRPVDFSGCADTLLDTPGGLRVVGTSESPALAASLRHTLPAEMPTG